MGMETLTRPSLWAGKLTERLIRAIHHRATENIVSLACGAGQERRNVLESICVL